MQYISSDRGSPVRRGAYYNEQERMGRRHAYSRTCMVHIVCVSLHGGMVLLVLSSKTAGEWGRAGGEKQYEAEDGRCVSRKRPAKVTVLAAGQWVEKVVTGVRACAGGCRGCVKTPLWSQYAMGVVEAAKAQTMSLRIRPSVEKSTRRDASSSLRCCDRAASTCNAWDHNRGMRCK